MAATNPPSTPGLTRRQLLKVGGIGALGLTLPQFLHAGETSDRRSNARSCIFIVQYGGCSHIDSFDPKPERRMKSASTTGRSPPRFPGRGSLGELLPRFRRAWPISTAWCAR